MSQLTVGSLFSGIGGLELGLERAGMRVVWQVEKDDYCQRVLAKHWPDVERFEDVRDVGAHNLKPVDLICGGFPCQDISQAGNHAGIEGEQSGLYREYLRIVGDLRPRYVFMENVSALLVRGLDRVLGSLAAIGYDARWDCIPASYVGAPHRRDRIWIVADAQSQRCEGKLAESGGDSQGLSGNPGRDGEVRDMAHTNGWWATEPDVGRVANGVPRRVDRLRALGNAVVPQVAELIGHWIVEADKELRQSA